ncbi:MAG: hypothetical protein FWD49_07755, partial [Firmicutes bacterium]|nr:hypothetical protein [Bacillota bacterium]
SYINNINAGIATVKVIGISNLYGEASASFVINQRNIASGSSVSFGGGPYIYTGQPLYPQVSTVTGAGLLMPEDSFTTQFHNNINAGGNPYVLISAVPSGNFFGSFTYNFTIQKADITDVFISEGHIFRDWVSGSLGGDFLSVHAKSLPIEGENKITYSFNGNSYFQDFKQLSSQLTSHVSFQEVHIRIENSTENYNDYKTSEFILIEEASLIYDFNGSAPLSSYTRLYDIRNGGFTRNTNDISLVNFGGSHMISWDFSSTTAGLRINLFGITIPSEAQFLTMDIYADRNITGNAQPQLYKRDTVTSLPLIATELNTDYKVPQFSNEHTGDLNVPRYHRQTTLSPINPVKVFMPLSDLTNSNEQARYTKDDLISQFSYVNFQFTSLNTAGRIYVDNIRFTKTSGLKNTMTGEVSIRNQANSTVWTSAEAVAFRADGALIAHSPVAGSESSSLSGVRQNLRQLTSHAGGGVSGYEQESGIEQINNSTINQNFYRAVSAVLSVDSDKAGIYYLRAFAYNNISTNNPHGGNTIEITPDPFKDSNGKPVSEVGFPVYLSEVPRAVQFTLSGSNLQGYSVQFMGKSNGGNAGNVYFHKMQLVADILPSATPTHSKTYLVSGATVTAFGRTYQLDNEDGVSFNNVMSGFEVSFNGTQLSAGLYANRDCFVDIYVNKGNNPSPDDILRRIKLSAGSNSYTLVSGLTAGNHTVRIMRTTENSDSEKSRLVSLSTNGSFIPPQYSRLNRRMEFYGASTFAGFGTLAPNGGDQKTVDNSNGALTMCAQSAHLLGAEFNVFASSGWGLGVGSTRPLQSVFDKFSPSDTDKHWNFNDYNPHMIVLNLGYNDTGVMANMVYNSPEWNSARNVFIANLKAFVVQLRARHPNAWIIVTYGVYNHQERERNLYGAYWQGIIQELGGGTKETSASRGLWTVEFTDPIGSDWGANWHPNWISNKRFANQLVNEINHITTAYSHHGFASGW